MELKTYQIAALDAFTRWRDELDKAQEQSGKAVAALESAGIAPTQDVVNYPKTAWQNMAQSGGVPIAAGSYVSRADGAERPIPHICFKVPTGGGKTLLAAAALERLNRQTGLTLWIVPSNAIYEQTKATLTNREHPYRQMLERASGGRVKILEKDDQLTAADVAHYMCVMLLSMQSANRKRNKNFLRMFRDSGRYPTFFPKEDDALGEAKLLNLYPDLERISENGAAKQSLLNVLKMSRPVTILDEAHRAYGKSKQSIDKLMHWVRRLNPSMVIELSATPNSNASNLLVDISGVELKQEEMIKLPVQVQTSPIAEWQNTLAKAHEELEKLQSEAELLHLDEDRYIRPIAVVRAERTGKDQRDGERIHAEDVREYLVQYLAVPPEAVAVKSSELDELQGKDLLSEYSPVRWIITKSALMEGWDCPFAYVLVMLDNTRAQRALTQLVGRVMRQPHAQRTDRKALDQCYVYCCNADVGTAVQQVKNGLENEGLTGLGDDVFTDAPQYRPVLFERRKRFRNEDIFLPKVNHIDDEGWVELDYQSHILPAIDWASIQPPDPQHSMADPARWQSATVDIGETLPVFHEDQKMEVDRTFKISWYARRLGDVVPNAWQAARIVQEFVDKLRAAKQTDEDIHDRRECLASALRKHVTEAVEKQAEEVFRRKLSAGEIRFSLEVGQPRYCLLENYKISVPIGGDNLFPRKDLREMQLSLFKPVIAHQFDSNLERNFAQYLDEQKALEWWYKVAARQRDHYYIRGWKQNRIWPDFIAMGMESGGKSHVLVFETKGEHLKGNDDTNYKQRVLETLENAFNCGTMTVQSGPAKGTFRLVFNEAEFPEATASLAPKP